MPIVAPFDTPIASIKVTLDCMFHRKNTPFAHLIVNMFYSSLYVFIVYIYIHISYIHISICILHFIPLLHYIPFVLDSL